MEQILFAYGLPKQTVAAIMMPNRNTKVKVCSPDGDTDYFDIVASVLQVDTLAPYLFIICLDYVLGYSLERAVAGIGLHVNADKTEYMCFNQRSDISTLNGNSQKLVDKFTYQGSSVSSTETDINIRLAKAWRAIDSIGHMDVRTDR